MKGEEPAKCSVGHAIPTVEKVSAFLDKCSDTVQELLGKKMNTNGPQGTVSNKTQISISMVASGLQKLQNILVDISANYQAPLELQSCLTCVVEDLHEVTKMKHPTPTICSTSARFGGFGNSMREKLEANCPLVSEIFYQLTLLLPSTSVGNEAGKSVIHDILACGHYRTI